MTNLRSQRGERQVHPTAGKLVLGLMVFHDEYRPIRVSLTTERHFGDIIPPIGQAAGLLTAAVTTRKQCRHAIMDRAVAVRKPSGYERT